MSSPSPVNPLDTLGLRYPLLQAPMAGVSDYRLAIAIGEAGGLGALPCAFYDNDQVRSQVSQLREQSSAPYNLNFFCHRAPEDNPSAQARWRDALTLFYRQYGLEDAEPKPGPARRSFGPEQAALVEELRPAVVSFHFGLPTRELLERVKAAGAIVLSSANTAAEGQWLEANGVDAVIAQGIEAGGHRAMFLSDSLEEQPTTLALVDQLVTSLQVPVIAAGGIGNRDLVSEALSSGAAAVQLGTALMLCPECNTSELHRQALKEAPQRGTVVTNLYSGRPARSIETALTRRLGPISELAPAFPTAGQMLGPLRAAAESAGEFDFTPVWSGTRPETCREVPVRQLISELFA